MSEHAKISLALKWVAQRKAGIPEDRFTYHPHRHVRCFINEGWEEMGRREEERRKEREAEERRREEERERQKEERKREQREKDKGKRSEEELRRNGNS